MGLKFLCSSDFYDDFPCGMAVEEVVAIGLATGSLALIAAFVLARQVRKMMQRLAHEMQYG